MDEILKDHTTKGILLIDAEIAFNSINRNAMRHSLKFICLVISTYISTTYACPLRLFIIGGSKLLSNERTIQEDPTSVGCLLSRDITTAVISAQFYFHQRTQR